MTFRDRIIQKFVLLTVLVALTGSFLLAQKPVVRIGIVFDGPSEGNAPIQETYTREITELLQEEFDIRFPADKTLTADWTAEGSESAITRLLEDPEVDQVGDQLGVGVGL